MYVAILLMAETRDNSDKQRENCRGCLGIVSFLSLPPQKREGEKEQRIWLFASLLSDLQTAGRSACEDGWLQALISM